ncbi:hypothetical protein Pmar_PMAR002477, partial [Perkinsus marinus ATCC 50983]
IRKDPRLRRQSFSFLMAEEYRTRREILSWLLPFIIIALTTTSWRLAIHQQQSLSLTKTLRDELIVLDKRELFSGEWAIGSLHQCSPRPLREDFSSWNVSAYEVRRCPSKDIR